MKRPAPAGPVSKKPLGIGSTVAALVPEDMQLVGSSLRAMAGICLYPGDADKPAVFELLGGPPAVVTLNGQQVPLATVVRLPLQYMGTDKCAFGWCWPEEFALTPAAEPAKLVH